MAEVSECSNICSEQEFEAGISAGMERLKAPPSEMLLVGEVPEAREGAVAPAAPAHVTRLLAWIRQAPDADAMDALFAVLFVLAVETGFTPSASPDGLEASPRCDVSAPTLRRIARMPGDWRRRRPGGPRYLVDLDLGAPTGCPPAAQLVGVACGGDVLIANMVAGDAAFSVGLAARDYVDGDGRLRSPGRLSRTFKDAVAAPARAAVLASRGLCSPSLLGLPGELRLYLLCYLAVPDLFHLGQTCRALAALLDDPAVWRGVARRAGLGADGHGDWKERVRQERQRAQRAPRPLLGAVLQRSRAGW